MTNKPSSARRPLHFKKLVPLTSLLITIAVSGCSSTRNCISALCAPYEAAKGSCTTERQARRCARSVWDTHHAQCYLNNCHYKEVREGFIAGFISVCNGGNTCPPMFAPAKHGLCGLNKRCSTAWHEGWPLGAIAAESSGFCNSCCSRAHPCLRGPRIPCNPGCVSCGDAAGQYSDNYMMESIHVQETPVEGMHVEIQDPVGAEHPYEAPIGATIEAAPEPAETAPAPPVAEPTALPAPTPAPEPKSAPAPPAPQEQSVQLPKPLSPESQMAEQLRAPIARPTITRTRSIAGIQDAGTRIATLIEEFETDAAR